jgi:hypothetical protein
LVSRAYFLRLQTPAKQAHTKLLFIMPDFYSFLNENQQKGVGYSIANQRRFCKWLRQKTIIFSLVLAYCEVRLKISVYPDEIKPIFLCIFLAV